MTPTEKLRTLAELADSPGWRLVREQMAAEIATATQRLTSPGPIAKDDQDFRRGAIWAAHQLLDLPQRLRTTIENELLIQQANATATPAKAGAKE